MSYFTSDAAHDLTVSATFPDSNPFGHITNGEANKVFIHLANGGSKNYTLVSAAASYHDPAKYWSLVKNQTVAKFGVPLVSGANFSAPFNVYSQHRPQELGLTVWVNVAESIPGSKTVLIPITALNQTVSIVEAPTGLLDPSLLFIYALVLSGLAAAGLWAYNLYFGTNKSKSKGKGQGQKIKAVVPADQDRAYPDVKAYEEDWIPKHHISGGSTKLKKRTAGKGTGASSAGEDFTSAGEATSGGESGVEGKKGKRKTKRA